VRNAIALVVTFLIAGTPAWADSREMHWSDLTPFIGDHSVALTLPDGARIEGRVIAVEPQTLVIDVRKTSNPQAHAKGRQSIPRDQAKSVVVNRPTIRWRVVGTSVGAVAGFPIGLVAAVKEEGIFSKGNGYTAVFIAAIAGLATAGFLIGWAADRRKTTVTIIPDAPTR
jgi:hypothetical protein